MHEIWNWISNNKTFHLSVKPNALRELIEEIDEDGSGLLEFGEFCQLAAKFLVEEDEEALKKELKEAFRIYDKEGMYRTRATKSRSWFETALNYKPRILDPENEEFPCLVHKLSVTTTALQYKSQWKIG